MSTISGLSSPTSETSSFELLQDFHTRATPSVSSVESSSAPPAPALDQLLDSFRATQQHANQFRIQILHHLQQKEESTAAELERVRQEFDLVKRDRMAIFNLMKEFDSEEEEPKNKPNASIPEMPQPAAAPPPPPQATLPTMASGIVKQYTHRMELLNKRVEKGVKIKSKFLPWPEPNSRINYTEVASPPGYLDVKAFAIAYGGEGDDKIEKIRELMESWQPDAKWIGQVKSDLARLRISIVGTHLVRVVEELGL